ncbi:MAG: lipopolysaccharide transport periplasmic protein LptA [Gammaproteobacteria bacterium]
MHVKAISVLALLFAFTAPVWSLESDSRQPIYIEADGATYDDKTGVSVYTGEVQVTQGSMLLNSDKLVVYTKDRKPYKFVATGDPVTFKQTPKPGDEDIHGRSLTAEYYTETEMLVMIEQAVVWQGKDTYASERIEYDRKHAIVKAGQASSSGKRVRITLHPKEETEAK